MEGQEHPRDCAINAASKARWAKVSKTTSCICSNGQYAHDREICFCWEEIAQLNAGINLGEAMIANLERDCRQWKAEARAAKVALDELRKLIPTSIAEPAS